MSEQEGGRKSDRDEGAGEASAPPLATAVPGNHATRKIRIPPLHPGIRTFITSVVVPLLVAVGGTWGANQMQNRDNRLMQQRQAFVDEARTFDSVVAAYVQGVMEKSPSSDATQKIINNLVQQSSLLDQVSNQLPPTDKHLASDYRHLLVQFREDLPRADSVIHLKTFWEDASKILVARNELLDRLQH